jgi:hypothetical protein
MSPAVELRLIPRVVLPRFASGIDYGARRRILIRAGEDRTSRVLMLTGGVQRPTAGVPGFGRVYHPAQLSLGTVGGLSDKTLGKGRVTHAVLTRHREAIDAWFGIPGVAAEIDLRKTLEIVGVAS